MKFCSRCGKELFDEAVICPGCGCATGAPNQSTGVSIAPQLNDFKSRVNGYFVRSIFGLILALGIGFIFIIINLVKKDALEKTVLNPTIPAEIAEYQSARGRLRAGIVMTAIAALLLSVGIFAAMIIGMTSGL